MTRLFFILGPGDLEWDGRGRVRFIPNTLIARLASEAVRAGVSLAALRRDADTGDWMAFERAIGADVEAFCADPRVSPLVVNVVRDAVAKFRASQPGDPAVAPTERAIPGTAWRLITNPNATKP